MVDRNYRRYVQSKVKVYTDTKENVKSYNKFFLVWSHINFHSVILCWILSSFLKRRNAEFDINSDELSGDQFTPGTVHTSHLINHNLCSIRYNSSSSSRVRYNKLSMIWHNYKLMNTKKISLWTEEFMFVQEIRAFVNNDSSISHI